MVMKQVRRACIAGAGALSFCILGNGQVVQPSGCVQAGQRSCIDALFASAGGQVAFSISCVLGSGFLCPPLVHDVTFQGPIAANPGWGHLELTGTYATARIKVPENCREVNGVYECLYPEEWTLDNCANYRNPSVPKNCP